MPSGADRISYPGWSGAHPDRSVCAANAGFGLSVCACRHIFCRDRHRVCTRPARLYCGAIGTSDRGHTCGRSAEGVAFDRSEEHTSELQSLMRISYAVFCLKKKKSKKN